MKRKSYPRPCLCEKRSNPKEREARYETLLVGFIGGISGIASSWRFECKYRTAINRDLYTIYKEEDFWFWKNLIMKSNTLILVMHQKFMKNNECLVTISRFLQRIVLVFYYCVRDSSEKPTAKWSETEFARTYSE